LNIKVREKTSLRDKQLQKYLYHNFYDKQKHSQKIFVLGSSVIQQLE